MIKTIIITLIVISIVVGISYKAYQFFALESFKERKRIDSQPIETEQLKGQVVVQREVGETSDQISQLQQPEILVKDNIDTSEWKIYVNNEDGYSIKHPPEVSLQGDGRLADGDLTDIKYLRGFSGGINIEINKHILSDYYNSFDELKRSIVDIESNFFEDPAEEMKLGKYIKFSQYTKTGPGGAFMTYIAHDENSDVYYTINSFDGYAEDKEIQPAVEEMLKTFEIL